MCSYTIVTSVLNVWEDDGGFSSKGIRIPLWYIEAPFKSAKMLTQRNTLPYEKRKKSNASDYPCGATSIGKFGIFLMVVEYSYTFII